MAESLNVSNVQFNLLTHDKILELSNGVITEEGLPIYQNKDKYSFKLPDRGLFSEKIFGISPFSVDGRKAKRNHAEFSDRNYKFGHIETPLYINPFLYGTQQNTLSKILSFTKSNHLKSLLEYTHYLVYVPSDNDNAFKFHSSLEKQKSVFSTSFIGLNGDFYLMPAIDSEKNKLSNVSEIESCFELMKEDDSIIITTGAISVAFLLSKMSFTREMKLCLAIIKTLQEKELNKVELSTKEKTILKNTSIRYLTIENLVKNNIKPMDLVSDKLLVIPAGWRDISVIKDSNGVVKSTKASINKHYADILNKSMTIKKAYPNDFNLKRIFANKNDNSWIKKGQILNKPYIGMLRGVQNSIKLLFDTEIISKIGVKEGKIRQSVLSKRLDFTGRAVITPDPQLELDELGVPMYIILEFYKNRLSDLVKSGSNFSNIIKMYMSNKNSDKFKVEESDGNEYLDIKFQQDEDINSRIELINALSELISNHRIINIRFPSLHRYSALGFRIKIVFDNTIHLHPLVCAPYNADFDGDNMSVYLIETKEAVKEVDEKLLPSKNLLNSNGVPFILPSQDAILGTYYLTLSKSEISSNKKEDNENKKVKKYKDYESMIKDYEIGRINIHDEVIVKLPRYDNSIYMRNFYNWDSDKKYIGETKKYSGVDYHSLPYIDSEVDKELIKKVPILEDYTCKPEEYVTSTVGRFILNSLIPQDLGYVDRNNDKYSLEIDSLISERGSAGVDSKIIKNMVTKVIDSKPIEEVKFVLDGIKELGYKYATNSGMSIAISDLYTHPDKAKLVNEAQLKVSEIEELENNKEITPQSAKEQKINIWTEVNEQMTERTMESLPSDNPIKMMSISGSRGNTTQVAQLMSMRGLMANTSGEVIETPVLSSFLDGLSMPEYFIGSYGTRKGMFDRSNRTKETGKLTRTAVYGNSAMIVSIGDCGDTSGYEMKDLTNKDGEILKSIGDRVYGKITCEDLLDEDGNVIVEKGKLIERNVRDTLNKVYKGKSIRVRSPITCKAKSGVCAKCYGKHLGANRFSRIGDSVGVIASQTIGEPGTQLTMRTFHTGGVAKGDVTKGFDEMSSLLESKAFEPLVEMKYEGCSLDRERLEEIQKKTIENILKFKDIEDKVIDGYDFDYEMFGVVNDKSYVTSQTNIKEALQDIYLANGIDLSDTHYEITSRSMGSDLKVLNSGDSEFEVGQLISWNDLVVNNIGLVLKGKLPLVAIPEFQSMTSKGTSSDTPMVSLMYQNLNKSISRAIAYKGNDNAYNPLLSIALSNKFVSPSTAKMFDELADEKDYEKVIDKKEKLAKLGIDIEDIKPKAAPEETEFKKVGDIPVRADQYEDYKDRVGTESSLEWTKVNSEEISETINPKVEEKNIETKSVDLSWGTSENSEDLEDNKEIKDNEIDDKLSELLQLKDDLENKNDLELNPEDIDTLNLDSLLDDSENLLDIDLDEEIESEEIINEEEELKDKEDKEIDINNTMFGWENK